ncbi:MAG: NAD(+)/NADH kinase [bacterium]|jgi:NAD+ kinase
MIEVVGIVANRRKPAVKGVLEDLFAWLGKQGISAIAWDDLEGVVPECRTCAIEDIGEGADLVIALGGDGTLLTAARGVGDRLTPILGVNVGSLGFLTEISVNELEEALGEVVKGKYRWEDRMNIQAEVIRDGRPVGTFTALNDVVINKGALSRVVELTMWADDHDLAVFIADGLIVSTPTGSTAYSLSAGGPIVNPMMEAIISTPICPHTLAVRPMILDGDQTLTVELWSGDSVHGKPEIKLTVDGQIGFELMSQDKIVFTRSARKTRLVLSGYRSFYEVLRQKLKWGDTRRKS